MAKQTIKQLADGFYTCLPSYIKIINLTEKYLTGKEFTEKDKVDYYKARKNIRDIVSHYFSPEDRLRILKKSLMPEKYVQKARKDGILRLRECVNLLERMANLAIKECEIMGNF